LNVLPLFSCVFVVLDVATVRPVINQIEWHPVWFQPSFLEWSNQQGIAIQSYSRFVFLTSAHE
jgi:diketogulonate reductase-like aldo/keto reductase